MPDTRRQIAKSRDLASNWKLSDTSNREEEPTALHTARYLYRSRKRGALGAIDPVKHNEPSLTHKSIKDHEKRKRKRVALREFLR